MISASIEWFWEFDSMADNHARWMQLFCDAKTYLPSTKGFSYIYLGTNNTFGKAFWTLVSLQANKIQNSDNKGDYLQGSSFQWQFQREHVILIVWINNLSSSNNKHAHLRHQFFVSLIKYVHSLAHYVVIRSYRKVAPEAAYGPTCSFLSVYFSMVIYGVCLCRHNCSDSIWYRHEQ